MPAGKIDTIVWDVGNVFIYWDPAQVYRDDPRFDTRTLNLWSEQVIKGAWGQDTYGWNSEVDRGLSIAETLADRIARFPVIFPELAKELPDYAQLLALYFEQWELSIDKAVPGTRELRDGFRNAGYRTFALTNFSAETWPRAMKLYPYLEQFDGIVMSGEVRMVKPDRDIYEHLFAVHNILPEKAVFIDDSQPNIDTARQLGLNTILFQPNRTEPDKALAKLVSALKALGVG